LGREKELWGLRETQRNLLKTIVRRDGRGFLRKGSGWWYPNFPLDMRILEGAQILCRMDGKPGNTSCPNIEWGTTSELE